MSGSGSGKGGNRLNELKKGDTIKCKDKDDMVNTFMELQKEGVGTDFLYEKDGKKGLWLIVLSVEGSENG
jgi:hypothetical protein